jgi:hypothetical protein
MVNEHSQHLGWGQDVLDQAGVVLLFTCLARGRGVWLDVISSPVFGLFHNEITDNFVDVVTATIENCYSI